MENYIRSAAKAANLCVQAFQELPERVTIESPLDGAFQDPDPTKANNAAFVNGLLGRSPGAADARSAAEAAGVCVEWKRSDLPCRPDAGATVQITLEKGRKRYFFTAVCTGPENCRVDIFDRVPVKLRGDRYEFLIFLETRAADRKEALAQTLCNRCSPVDEASFATNGTCWLITIPCGMPVERGLLDELNAMDDVQLALQLSPVIL